MYYASDFRRKAREVLRGNWMLAVIVGLVAGFFGANGYATGNSSKVKFEDITQNANVRYDFFFISLFLGVAVVLIFFIAIAIIFGGAIEIGYSRFNLNLINLEDPRFADLFSGFNIFGKAFIMRLLMGLYTFLWSLLFIIPGIIASFSYTMTPYILCENPDLGANEAIGISKEIMAGNKWRYFCLELSFIGWEILCAFTFGLGHLWLVPYKNAAKAAFYCDISQSYNHRSGDNEERYW